MNRHGRLLLGAIAATVAAGVAASAQAPVTLTLRSGETMKVTLVDLKAAGFEVRVDGSEQMIAKDRVAVVDFGSSPTTAALAAMQERFTNISANRHLVVFKNGTTELINWVDVGGTSPLVLRFATGGAEEREISANDVARIYLAAPPGPVTPGPTNPGTGTPSEGGPQPDGSVIVLATTAWNRTGVTVRTGDFLRFQITGEVRFGPGADDTSGPGGSSSGRGILARNLPVRILPMGGLIGAVGNNPPFSIGTAPQAIRMPGNGELVLGVNDVNFNDNAGSFRVVITRGR